jgi:hypothetical protein
MHADLNVQRQGRRHARGACAAVIVAALSLLLACGAGAQTLGRASSKAAGKRASARRLNAHPSKKPKHKPTALLVGTFNGKKGKYKTIQEAVNAAQEGDWILIAPGDYKQTSSTKPSGAYGDDLAGASVLITTPNIHVRGMNRATVMIDGTKPGTPECASEESAQNFGAQEDARWLGNNGVVVYKASGVTLQNFSACNFLGSNHGGDTVWFDGGGATGKQAIGSWWGEYLSTTSTYWGGKEKPSAEYGIYASNTTGPGIFDHTYAGNMSDSGYYIGACPDCNSTINNSRSESNDLGYSGSNSGGHLTIENSIFRDNEEGVATQSQNNDDAPSPQEGRCPKGENNPNIPAGAQRKDICWVMINNKVIGNDNGATPTSPSAPGLLGTGMSIAGGRNDLVIGNTFANNDAWGILLVPYPGVNEKPPPQVLSAFPEDECRGGVSTPEGENTVCLYEAFENEIVGNTFTNNGAYKNASNGDIGEINDAMPTDKDNCWHGNVEKGGAEPSSEPAEIQKTHTCELPDAPPASGEPVTSPLGQQATCDSQLLAECPNAPGSNYPRSSEVEIAPLPQEESMANPCEGVPSNLRADKWCRRGKAVGGKNWG